MSESIKWEIKRLCEVPYSVLEWGPAAWSALCTYDPSPLSLLSSLLSPGGCHQQVLGVLTCCLLLLLGFFLLLFVFVCLNAFPKQRRSPRVGCAGGLSLRERGIRTVKLEKDAVWERIGTETMREGAEFRMKQEASKLGKRDQGRKTNGLETEAWEGFGCQRSVS